MSKQKHVHMTVWATAGWDSRLHCGRRHDCKDILYIKTCMETRKIYPEKNGYEGSMKPVLMRSSH